MHQFMLRQLGIALLASFTGVATAQVQYFDAPPSVEALRQALNAPPAAASPGEPEASGRQPRSRGIKWHADANPAQGSAAGDARAEPAPAQVAAPVPGTGRIASAETYRSAAPAVALPISFDSGSSRVLPTSFGYVSAIAQLLQRDSNIRVVIEGHTDSLGAYEPNMVLSWDRALAVFRLLVEQYGIDPVRLQPLGRGPLDPIPGTSPANGMNRRVQIRIAS